MKIVPYQLVLLGERSSADMAAFKEDFLTRVSELGIDPSTHVKILYSDNLTSFQSSAPLVAVFFGSPGFLATEAEAAQRVVDTGFMIIPVVDSLDYYQTLVPECLYPVNGFALQTASGGVAAVTSAVLETLNLLRRTRKLFISYRRKESKVAAIQLYEHLDSCGFDVFLDTLSIRPGEPFQEVLWHKLSDTDVVILLDTPGYLQSRWTSEELAKASAMSIGIIQVIWPGHQPDPITSLCERLYLSSQDVTPDANEQLSFTDDAVAEIAKLAESLRARSLSARYYNLVGELKLSASELDIEVILQPQQFVIIKTPHKEIAAIPTVGVPEAMRYQEFSELLVAVHDSTSDGAVLLYDDNNLRKRWQEHLQWLDTHLPIKSVRIAHIKQWLTSL
ncbi:toll/interleukin-1 receptor domain-containing protein [Hymenobacter sublimis]|uniref:Toll/interleukin-1 receptor domain-containing protein n=1 Tax=Hymenobacter sublimis TaxID=2933777 RepID=A0ABY4JBL6_9BACT|nr:toll/interleukin-1 receptor domain-containing protein [Hymenobacter sublimis]UPL50214.1 toll/interleukin-1 receptor domain-containing protein [Hymenobacter sublimis]